MVTCLICSLPFRPINSQSEWCDDCYQKNMTATDRYVHTIRAHEESYLREIAILQRAYIFQLSEQFQPRNLTWSPGFADSVTIPRSTTTTEDTPWTT